jgi:hypothetical protein
VPIAILSSGESGEENGQFENPSRFAQPCLSLPTTRLVDRDLKDAKFSRTEDRWADVNLFSSLTCLGAQLNIARS